MTDPAHRLLDEGEWDFRESIVLPTPGEAHGLSREQVPLDALLSDLSVAQIPELEARLAAHFLRADPRVILVDARTSRVDARGAAGCAARISDTTWYVDSRRGAGALLFRDLGLALQVEDGTIYVAHLRGLEQWEPPTEFVPTPPVAEWLSRWPHQRWLQEETAALCQRSDDVSRAAAAGLCVRLWRTSPSAVAPTLVAAVGGPGRLAQEWFLRLSERVRDALAESVVDETHLLTERLPAIGAASSSGERRAAAVSWLVRRDDLESARVLWRTPPQSVVTALEILDREAVADGEAFAGLETNDVARLHQAFIGDPDAWWAAAAG